MRPTFVVRSEMPGPKVYNPWWGSGEAQKMKGVVQYSLSPTRTRAMHNLIRNYVFNGYRRLSAHVGYWIVPFALGYGTYTWAKSYDTWLNSKAAHVAGHGSH
ncbi:hypothetical protein K474DRAFT_1657836 [Panus rudis PR-1116 ss-1]|nr:hypothetical protein K474DRAFT_1657836 [Panus rudis PR-1116 ss-1]